MIDVPDAVSEDPFFDLLGLAAELFQIVDVLLKVLIKQLLCIAVHLQLGSLSSAAFFSFYCFISSSEEESSELKKLRLSLIVISK
jgi:hypothetical protein